MLCLWNLENAGECCKAQWVWVHQRIALYKSYLLLFMTARLTCLCLHESPVYDYTTHIFMSTLLTCLWLHDPPYIDWLMIAYIALFSALLSRLIALACGSTWMTSFIALFVVVEYPPKWCTYSAGKAGATWNCSRLGASPVYTIQPCSMSLHAKLHTHTHTYTYILREREIL